MKYIILLIAQLAVVTALTCYQGQQNNSVSVSGSATECPQQAVSCLKSVDNATGIATRACQQTACSVS